LENDDGVVRRRRICGGGKGDAGGGYL
jgi:hypothetical protein